jgi:hypothetical protein
MSSGHRKSMRNLLEVQNDFEAMEKDFVCWQPFYSTWGYVMGKFPESGLCLRLY